MRALCKTKINNILGLDIRNFKLAFMQKTFFIFVFILDSLVFNAQYRKLPLDTNYYWQQSSTIHSVGPVINCNYFLKVDKEVTFNGKIFKSIMSFGESNYQCVMSRLLRQDTALRIVTTVMNNQEYILYNFNKSVGDTATLLNDNGTAQTFTLVTKDSILINDGFYHKRFVFNGISPIIEGVGGINGLLGADGFEADSRINCLGRISPALTIYNSAGLGTSCSLTTGVALNKGEEKEFKIFPNPATDLIHMRFENSVPKSVTVKNLLGETIMQYNDVNGDVLTVEINNFASGFYFVHVNFVDGLLTRSFIKN